MKSLFLVLILIVSTPQVHTKEMNPIDSAIVWQTQKFRTILATAYNNHKDSVDIKKISEAAFSAMLKQLDPYSDYLPEDVYTEYKANYSKTVRTVGLGVVSIADTLFVLYVRPDSPADSAGILPGDMIIYMDGKSAIGLSPKEASKKFTVSDSVPKSLNLVTKRYASPGLNEYFLPPEQMPIISFPGYFILPGTDIGYIKSKRFSKTSDSVFHQILQTLKKQGAKRFVFDIRGHYGGQVKDAADIADEFIPEGKTITYIEGKNNKYYQKYISEPDGLGEGMPLVVLTDGQTMSAAEIFAGAIQDLDKGVIVGDITYGKGMAQKTWSFKDGSAFRLTIGDYYSPIGRNIQKPHEKEKVELDPALRLNVNGKTLHNIEKALKRFGGKNKIPTFETPKGRIVLGGGGIYPDFFVLPDTTTLLTRVLKSKSIIIEAVFQYLNLNRDKLLDKYGNNYTEFDLDFVVTDEMLRDLEQVSRHRNIWNESMFQTDKEYLRNYYKSLLGYFLWGDDAFYMNEANTDKVLQEGIKHFTDAEKLIMN
jgi:carboxyl-terminal processing protease